VHAPPARFLKGWQRSAQSAVLVLSVARAQTCAMTVPRELILEVRLQTPVEAAIREATRTKKACRVASLVRKGSSPKVVPQTAPSVHRGHSQICPTRVAALLAPRGPSHQPLALRRASIAEKASSNRQRGRRRAKNARRASMALLRVFLDAKTAALGSTRRASILSAALSAGTARSNLLPANHFATSACLVDSRTSKGLQTARRAKRGITQQTTPPLHVTNALSVDTRVQAAKQIVRVAQKAVTTHQTLNRTVYLAPVEKSKQM